MTSVSPATISTSTANEQEESSWKDRIEKILSEDRSVLNFEYYRVSDEHSQRMKKLSTTVPHLYNNPKITPRSKWFDHPQFFRNAQMPPFHIHFRQEVQTVLKYLYQAYQFTDDARNQQKCVKRALRMFTGSMRGLSGHVNIEEYVCFPVYQECFPEVNIDFLFKDHETLKRAEHNIQKELEELSQLRAENIGLEELRLCLEHVLNFDEQLMAHLGEEEEIVVPMSLTDKEIWF